MRVQLAATGEMTRLWLPLALASEPHYQKVMKQTWTGNARTLWAIRDEIPGAAILFAEWPEGDAAPSVDLTLHVATRDRTVDWTSRDPSTALRTRARPAVDDVPRRYLAPTRLIPLDGIVGETARRITRNESDGVAKARAIYEWIVEHTERDPAVAGCGIGDVRGMLQSGNLRGKCADLNALFVGLARASGVPARDVYGLRVAPSRAFASLSASGDVTRAQHCRAEFHSPRHGWVPVDPADVRKVILEEKPGLTLASREVQYARRQLFGSWESNWIAFNDAHDVRLPRAAATPLPFLMYPHAEVGGRRLDNLDPSRFAYRITAREL